jgi:hypothetical protein
MHGNIGLKFEEILSLAHGNSEDKNKFLGV